MSTLDERLNKILPTLNSESFRQNHGLGNEVPFYAFDYAPEAELQVREHVNFLVENLAKDKSGYRVARINLFAIIIEMLDGRGFYDKSVTTQTKKGNDALLKQLKGTLDAEIVAKYIAKHWSPNEYDAYLIDGVGSAYPLIRTHSLLNALQPLFGLKPLVLFFPGEYDGQSLSLFGQLGDTPYYRAFRLVD